MLPLWPKSWVHAATIPAASGPWTRKVPIEDLDLVSEVLIDRLCLDSRRSLLAEEAAADRDCRREIIVVVTTSVSIDDWMMIPQILR